MTNLYALGKQLIGKTLIINMIMVAALMVTAKVVAQDQHRVLEEVLVTATKRDTLLQDTPIAVSVFSQEALTRAGLSEVNDLAVVVPNLSMGTEGFSNALEVSMRGITSSSNTDTSNPAVSINLDGVYIPRASGANALFYDVERVEVLRGPQGTLFGRNSIGGAINVISHRPTDQFEGSFELVAGNYGNLAARGVINIPVSNSFALRASLQAEERDGYFNNSSSPISVDDYGSTDQVAGRISALFTPTDNFSWLLVYESVNDSGTPTLGVPNPLPVGEDVFNRAVNDLGELDVNFNTFRSRADWDISTDLRISWVAGYGKLERFQKNDIDGGIAPLNLATLSDADNKFFTHDLQLQSTGDGDFQWTVGAFYFEEENDALFPFAIREANFAQLFDNKDRRQKAVAVYGQGTYSISDTVRLTAGARFTKDTKTDGDGNVLGCPGQGRIDLANLDATQCFLIGHSEREEDFDATTWRLGIDWNMSDDILLYGSAATGFKSGGFSNIAPAWDEETVLTIEAGLKGTFLDGTLRVNAALFTSAYDDLQVSQVVNGSQFTENAAEATINGLEIEGVWLIGENTQIDGFISWLDAEFDEYENSCDASQSDCVNPGPDDLLNLSGNKLNRAPESSMNLAIEHRFTGPYGTLTPRLSVHWEDNYYLRVFNNNETDLVDSWTKTDITLTYEPNDSNWQIQLYAKNIEDDEIRQTAFTTPVGVIQSSYNTPRTYGAAFRYNWN